MCVRVTNCKLYYLFIRCSLNFLHFIILWVFRYSYLSGGVYAINYVFNLVFIFLCGEICFTNLNLISNQDIIIIACVPIYYAIMEVVLLSTVCNMQRKYYLRHELVIVRYFVLSRLYRLER